MSVAILTFRQNRENFARSRNKSNFLEAPIIIWGCEHLLAALFYFAPEFPSSA
jgi:hypothetical protein